VERGDGPPPYFVTGLHDDPKAVQQTYTLGPTRDVNHVLASSAMFVIVVNTIVAGGLVAFVVWPVGAWVAAIAGTVTGLVHVALWIRQGKRTFDENTDPRWVRFPTPGSDLG
jgi:hypothetical protein